MIDYLIQATLSNLLVTTILACLAWFVQTRIRATSLANLLWILVLVKMVTPPLFSVPLLEIASFTPVEVAAEPLPVDVPNDSLGNGIAPTDGAFALGALDEAGGTEDDQSTKSLAQSWMQYTLWLWLVISGALFGLSAFRILHFHIRLQKSCRVAPSSVYRIAVNVADKLGLGRLPEICSCSANTSPFVWCIGGKTRMVIPESAISSLNESDLRMVIAHEMAHLKRRDHWVRWIEWLAVMTCWWNPLFWLARRELRITEEIACDELAISCEQANRHQYANSLLNMAEILTTSAIRPPTIASAINSGGVFEKRLTMIINRSNQVVGNGWRFAIMLFAICVFPLGFVYSQDFEAISKRLKEAVQNDELSAEQARVMLEALKKNREFGHLDRDDRRRSDRRRDDRERELEQRKNHFEKVAREVEEAVKSGKLSERHAKEKLELLQKELFGLDGTEKSLRRKERRRDDHEREMEERERHFHAITKEIKQAVENGEMNERDAKKKLEALRDDLFGGAKEEKRERERRRDRGDHEREMEQRKRHFEEIAQEIEHAVKSGKMSERDAKSKLEAVHNELFGRERLERKSRTEAQQHEREKRELEKRERHFKEIAEEVESAVKAEKMSKQDAEKKLRAVHNELFGEKRVKNRRSSEEHSELERRKRNFAELANKIEKAVADGILTRNEAREKLQAFERELFGNKRSHDRELRRRESRNEREHHDEMEARELEFKEIVNKIEKEVKAGRLSKEKAREKIQAVKNELFGRDR